MYIKWSKFIPLILFTMIQAGLVGAGLSALIDNENWAFLTSFIYGLSSGFLAMMYAVEKEWF